MNILDLLKGQLGSGIAGQLGSILGEDESKTKSAIGAALPSLLGGLMGQASSTKGAEALHKQLQDHDGGIFDNLGSMLTGGGHTGLLNSGSGILNGLLGDKLGAVAGIISKLTGLGGSSSTSLMGMLAPLVMGFIGKTVKSKGMDAMGLQGLLMDQKEHVASAMPEGMGDALGLKSSLFDGLTGAAGNAAGAVTGAAGAGARAVGDAAGAVGGAASDGARAAAGAAGDAAQAGGSMLKALIPLILLGVLGYFGFQAMGGCGAAENAADGIGDAVEGAGDAVGGAIGDAKDALGGAVGSLPSLPSFNAENPVESLNGMFGSAKETLGGVTDVDSAKAALPGLNDLFSKLEGANAGISALPEAAQGPVKEAVGGFLPTLKEMVAKVTGIAGVEGVLGGVLGKIVKMLTGMGGA